MDLNSRGFFNYLLLPLSGLFYCLVKLRCLAYRFGLLKTHQFDKPVIVVGNITLGGSGKTPIVIALVKHLEQLGKKVGVVSRGYGGQHKTGSLLVEKNTQAIESGDEPLLIATETNARVMVNKNRAKAVEHLIQRHAVDVIISDDGLQHYAMDRNIEISIVNGKTRFGNGFLLPAGPLREPISRHKSVDFIINNGGFHAGEVTSTLVAKKFINLATGITKPLNYFKGQTCHGVAGIGHPQHFFDMLNTLDIKTHAHSFRDHYLYKPDDLVFGDDFPIIMTAKDCVKCRPFATENMWYLQVQAELSEDFLTKLDNKL